VDAVTADFYSGKAACIAALAADIFSLITDFAKKPSYFLGLSFLPLVLTELWE
jgi:hypothetical protein